MDNRGSKSVFYENTTVKEQRVDGSGCKELISLKSSRGPGPPGVVLLYI